MLQLSLAIVGIDHPNKRGVARRFELEICRPGEAVELRPEPKNPADENAIAVYSARGIQIGYLKWERAILIGAHMRHGRDVTAIFDRLDEKVAWCRVAFDGEQPVLPSAAAPDPADDSGFYPDEPAPDWGA